MILHRSFRVFKRVTCLAATLLLLHARRRKNRMTDVSRSAVLEYVNGHKQRMVEALSALIRIPTENPPGNCYRECQDELLRQLRDLELDAELIESDGAACV